jgi:hypothetical protein
MYKQLQVCVNVWNTYFARRSLWNGYINTSSELLTQPDVVESQSDFRNFLTASNVWPDFFHKLYAISTS